MTAKISRMSRRRQKIAIVRRNLNLIKEHITQSLQNAFVGRVINHQTHDDIKCEMLARLEAYSYMPVKVLADPDDVNKVIVEMVPAVRKFIYKS